MPLITSLVAFGMQSLSAVEPATLTERQLLTDQRIWIDGFPRTSNWPATETLIAAPLEAEAWTFVPHDSAITAAEVLARWILADETPPTPSVAGEHVPVRWLPMRRNEPHTATCAYTTITSAVDEIRIVRAPGAKWILWNSELFVGDEQSRGFEGVPVHVRQGMNSCFVALDGAPPRCSLVFPRATAWIDAHDVRWPKQLAFGDEIEYPVFNASLGSIQLTINYGHASGWNSECAPRVSEFATRGPIVPLGLQLCGHFYSSPPGACQIAEMDAPQHEWSPVEVDAGRDAIPDRRMLRRGPASWGADHNNVIDVPREPRSSAHGLVACLPPASTHLHAIGPGEGGSLALARFVQQMTWYRFGDAPRLASSAAFLAEERQGGQLALDSWSSPIVLYGNEETNPAWQRFVPRSVNCSVGTTRAVVRGNVFEGDDLAGWFTIRNSERSRAVQSLDLDTPQPDELAGWSLRTVPKDEHDVFVVFSTGDRGVRLASLLAVSWGGAATPTAVFRVDPSSVRGWKRLDQTEPR